MYITDLGFLLKWGENTPYYMSGKIPNTSQCLLFMSLALLVILFSTVSYSVQVAHISHTFSLEEYTFWRIP